jgi:hypothetical protein
MTPTFMCGALQDFAYAECGCGAYNPVCKSDSSKCYGGRNYKAPYIIPFDTRIQSDTTAVASTSTKPGSRNLLLRGPQTTADSSTTDSSTTIVAGDLHFEAKDSRFEAEGQEGADVSQSSDIPH